MEERKRNANTRKISSKLQKRKHSGSFFQVSGSCVWPAGAYRHRPDHWCGYCSQWPRLHRTEILYPDTDGSRRTGSQHHGPVFCGKSQRRFCHRSTPGSLWPHPEAFLYGAGYPWNRYPDHPSDRRRKPGTERCKHGPSSSSSKPVYCFRCHGDGLYHQRALCTDLRSCHPGTVPGCLCDHVLKYPSF